MNFGGRKMENEKKSLFTLFLSTLYLSAFTFGGGYVIITLMKEKFVNELNWIDNKEMLNLVAIAQSAPGPIAINGAILMGYKIMGVKGAIAAIMGTILPPFAIISVVSFFYAAFKSNIYVSLMLEGMQAGVGAVIASVVFDMASPVVKSRNAVQLIIMALSFGAVYFVKINVMWVILLCALWGAVRAVIAERRKI
jgi:chromate transporter